MYNTFWTEISGNFYRIKNNELFVAPIVNGLPDANNYSKVLSLDKEILKKVNCRFNTSFEFKP